MPDTINCDCTCHGDPGESWADWSAWCDECASVHDTSDIVRAARSELVCLWGDMEDAWRNALNTDFSIQMEYLRDRILTITKIIGPCPWQHIQIKLLTSGLYARIHKEAGISFPPIDWPIVNEIANEMKIKHDRHY